MSKKRGTVNHRRLARLFRRDGASCFWCRHPLMTHLQLRRAMTSGQTTLGIREATVDHVKPRDEGGTDDLYNLVAACAPCNVERSRSGNAIDKAIARGKYKLPARPAPLSDPARATKDEPQQRPVRAVDMASYVASIPWSTAETPPSATGLHLVLADHDRVLLVPVVVADGEVYVSQGGVRRTFNPTWRWCLLDTLLNR